MKKHYRIALIAFTFIILGTQNVFALETTSDSKCNYIQNYLSFGSESVSSDVIRLQQFLNSHEGENLSTNGIFRMETKQAVERFQMKYKDQILTPWGITSPTGYVYITTRNTINKLYCGTKIPYTDSEKSIILNNAVATDTTNTTNNKNIVTEDNNIFIGTSTINDDADNNDNYADVIGVSSTSSNVLRNIFSSPFALVILLILLAIVIYLMVTGRNEDDFNKPV